MLENFTRRFDLKIVFFPNLGQRKTEGFSSTLQRLHWKFTFNMRFKYVLSDKKIRKDREKKIDMLHHLMTLHFLPEV